MDPAAIVPFDLQRMFVGDHPLLFHLEIVVRTLIVYGYSLVLLRWLGSRTIGQLSTIEFLLVIALGSAVGDPMFYPDVPLVHALVVVTVVVLANRGLDILVARSKIAERVIDGEPQELIDLRHPLEEVPRQHRPRTERGVPATPATRDRAPGAGAGGLHRARWKSRGLQGRRRDAPWAAHLAALGAGAAGSHRRRRFVYPDRTARLPALRRALIPYRYR